MAGIDRTGAAALLKEDFAGEVMRGATEKSAAMTMFRRKKMTTKQQRMAVLAAYPTAYFVNGDTGLKQVTSVSWENKYLDAEPIAVIVPIPIDVMRDSALDWGEIKPLLEEAVAITIDNAVFFGINKPSSWPSAIVTAAAAAGNTVTRGTSAIDVADDINTLIGLVELDGYAYTGAWGNVSLKGRLRGLRDASRDFIFQPSGPANVGVSKAAFVGTLFNEKFVVSTAGLTNFSGTGNTELIVGDWDQGIMGVREDIEYTVLNEATLYNTDGSVMYALAQQDMVALRLVLRVAFQVPNPINRLQQTAASRYPFGRMLAP